jgi:hypothetical protein
MVLYFQTLTFEPKEKLLPKPMVSMAAITRWMLRVLRVRPVITGREHWHGAILQHTTDDVAFKAFQIIVLVMHTFSLTLHCQQRGSQQLLIQQHLALV